MNGNWLIRCAIRVLLILDGEYGVKRERGELTGWPAPRGIKALNCLIFELETSYKRFAGTTRRWIVRCLQHEGNGVRERLERRERFNGGKWSQDGRVNEKQSRGGRSEGVEFEVGSAKSENDTPHPCLSLAVAMF